MGACDPAARMDDAPENDGIVMDGADWPQPQQDNSGKVVVSSDDVIQAMRERNADLLYENALLTAQIRKLRRDMETVRRELSHARRLIRQQSPESAGATPSDTPEGSPMSTASSPRDGTRR